MFLPYTKGSVLARVLKENKKRLFPMTKNKVKIVERTGVKLVDLLIKSDPWEGQDCERRNCFLCITRQQTEKNESQPCTKRSLIYETWCLMCKAKDKKLENQINDQHELKKIIRNIRLHKYLGETNRSELVRGWQHLNVRAKLDSERDRGSMKGWRELMTIQEG